MGLETTDELAQSPIFHGFYSGAHSLKGQDVSSLQIGLNTKSICIEDTGEYTTTQEEKISVLSLNFTEVISETD